MKWHDKVSRILEESGRTYAHIEKTARWKTNALSVAINRQSTPASDAGIRLARALDVPAEWLWDDEQDWPPPTRRGALYEANDIDYAALALKFADWLTATALEQTRESRARHSKKGDKSSRQP